MCKKNGAVHKIYIKYSFRTQVLWFASSTKEDVYILEYNVGTSYGHKASLVISATEGNLDSSV